MLLNNIKRSVFAVGLFFVLGFGPISMGPVGDNVLDCQSSTYCPD